MSLSVRFVDLVAILDACGAVRPAECTPMFLRAWIAAHLDLRNPRLAAIVRGFDDGQMMALAQYVLDGLELAEGPPSARPAEE